MSNKKIKIRVKKPWIGYPGTPIQQNYAEDLEHGYFVWNIDDAKKFDVKYHQLPNTKPFVTLKWTDDVEKTFELAKKYPQGSRFRIVSDVHIIQRDIHELTMKLRQDLCALEVTYKSDADLSSKNVKFTNSNIQQDDLRNIDVQLKLLKEYHKNSSIDTEEFDKISNKIRDYLKIVATGDDTIRNTQWSLKSLKFDNMFSYCEDNYINFENLNGVVGIFGQNRTGKSSIVGTLMYALYNATDRGPIKNLHVINVRKDKCSVRAVIQINGVDYVVERITEKNETKKGAIFAPTTLNLYSIDDSGDAHIMNGEQRNDTEKMIRKLIGTQDDFQITSLAAQDDLKQFINHGSTRRRQILSRFLDLDIFDKMHELAKNDLNFIKAQYKNVSKKDWKQAEDILLTNISNCEQELQTIDDKISFCRSELSKYEIELSAHHNSNPVTQYDVDQCNEQLNSTNRNLTNELKCESDYQHKIDDLKGKIQKIDIALKSVDVNDLKNRKEQIRKLELLINDVKHDCDVSATEIKRHKKSLQLLNDIPCGEKYPTCKFIKDAIELKPELLKEEQKSTQLTEKLQNYVDNMKKLTYENVDEKLDKFQKLQQMKSKFEIEVEKFNHSLHVSKEKIVRLNEKIELLTEQLQKYIEAIKNDDNVTIVNIKTEIDRTKKLIKKYDNDKIISATEIGRSKSQLEKVLNEKAEYDEALSKLKIYELITSAFSKKGIPQLIMQSQLPMLNEEVTKLLHGIVDFTIELGADDETDSMEIYINYGDSKRPIELCSGMEKTIASIALRVALINISSLPKSDVFIIDEGFGVFDESGVDAVNRLLGVLKTYFKTVLIITHVDGIKDATDQIVEISKREIDSYVYFE